MTTVCVAPEPSLTGYVHHRCRCDGCSLRSREYEGRRRRLIAYRQWQPLIDAEPARAHVRSLMTFGIGWERVAKLARVGNTTVGDLLYGKPGKAPTRKIRAATAAALLAVQPEFGALADGVRIDVTGTRRRVQALAAIGWCLSEQARRLGRSARNHYHVLTEERVTVSTYRAARRLYDQLSATPAPSGTASTRARAIAARRGWPPPLAWDDIDNPDAVPYVELAEVSSVVDVVAIERVLAGDEVRLTPLERHHAVHAGIAREISLSLIAHRIHVSYTTAQALAAQPLPAVFELAA